jgi:hypothetical protein
MTSVKMPVVDRATDSSVMRKALYLAEYVGIRAVLGVTGLTAIIAILREGGV